MIPFSLSLPVFVLQKSQRSNWLFRQSRNFVVKELSWCSNSKHKLPNTIDSTPGVQYRPIERFGIIAAMSNNNIIGVKGSIPWNIPADRKEFVRMTRDKVLIVGRKTFEEQPSLSHISHAAKCIVISNSLDGNSIQSSAVSNVNTEVLIVRSFPEALDVARRVVDAYNSSGNDTTDDISCWIAGGQDIYHKSVLHPSAWILHLTIINIDVDVSSYAPSEIARFPPGYHWDNRFTKISEKENISQDGEAIKFTQYIYKRTTFR
jgi:dihydrofolate reductase